MGYLKNLEDKKLIEIKKIIGNDKNIVLAITKKGIELKAKGHTKGNSILIVENY